MREEAASMASRSTFIERCLDGPKDLIECILAAETIDEMEACRRP
jgi:hypothetical protein